MVGQRRTARPRKVTMLLQRRMPDVVQAHVLKFLTRRELVYLYTHAGAKRRLGPNAKKELIKLIKDEPFSLHHSKLFNAVEDRHWRRAGRPFRRNW